MWFHNIVFLGVVKKVGGSCFKIVHEKFRARYAEEESSLMMRNMAEIARQHPDLKPSIQKSVVSLACPFCTEHCIFCSVLFFAVHAAHFVAAV